jgi:hypothetical protein
VLDSLWGLQHCYERKAPAPKAVGLSASAKAAWVEFYNAITRETHARDFPRHLIGPWRKLRNYGARLALVLHEARFACSETASEEMVDEASMRGAVELVAYFKTHAVRVHAMMAAKTQLPESDAALVKAVQGLLTASGGCWRGSAQRLREDLAPHAGAAVELPRWPQSNEAMGHAIRRVAGHLSTSLRVKVIPPPPTDKTRTIILTQEPPEPPKPPTADASCAQSGSCVAGGSERRETPTARTARTEAGDGAVRAVGSDGDRKLPEPQPTDPQGVTDAQGGLGGSGGFRSSEPDVEDEPV